MEAPIPIEKDTSADSLSATYAQRKQNAALLASQYTTSKRAGEIISVIAFVVLLFLSAFNLYQHRSLDYFLLLLVSSSILGMTLADLFSGLVHWGADTWGTLETPFVGQTFIRSFREHHVDPFQITRHDFVETNGDNCMLAAIPLAAVAFIKINHAAWDIFIVSFIMQLCVWVSLTNQIHKWAHMIKPPKYVAFFQDWRIILSRKNHQIHHHTPFDRYYCITTGWLNPVLGAIGFWKRLENAITAATGYIPRQDDAKWTVQMNDQKVTTSPVPN
jgi:ubiquitin-conjugating enzyme E2 variant